MAQNISIDIPEDEGTIETLDATNEDENNNIVAGKSNVLEMGHLPIFLVIDELLNKTNNVCTDEWPGGLATIWLNFRKNISTEVLD